LPIPPPDVEPTVTNRPPEASAVSLQANPLVPLVIALPAVDPDGLYCKPGFLKNSDAR
jgi:hypothetical protein